MRPRQRKKVSVSECAALAVIDHRVISYPNMNLLFFRLLLPVSALIGNFNIHGVPL